MNLISKAAIALTLSGAAYGQVPSPNDTVGRSSNTAGFEALYSSTAGAGNTGAGLEALHSNTTGAGNTALGWSALQQNSTGNNNMASGVEALNSNTSGSFNTAVGAAALAVNTTGSNNIAVGYESGYNLTGSNNIDIGNRGAAIDHNTIKIGTEGTQARTFVAGIFNTPVTGSAVMVNSSGQLGVVVSSERFKTAIAPMGADTARLQQLRPVSFHLKSDPDGALQYGLIAEEVAKVYPELVIRDQSGRIEGVRYDELAPMLLNEMQQQQRKIDAQAATMSALALQLADMRTALAAMQSRDRLLTQR